MPVPQIPDRVKEAPPHALRAVFAGIGRALLALDRIKKRDTRDTGDTGGTGPGPAAAPPPQPQPPDPHEPPATRPARSLDRTGNVRLLSAEDLADEPPPAPAPPAPAAAAPSPPKPPEPPEPPEPAAPEPPAAAPGDAGLPVPNYDSVSLPSLRARLRSLDTAQLHALADYERSHAARAEVVAMFERRIAKLAAGG
jgi:hypothetical protein